MHTISSNNYKVFMSLQLNMNTISSNLKQPSILLEKFKDSLIQGCNTISKITSKITEVAIPILVTLGLGLFFPSVFLIFASLPPISLLPFAVCSKAIVIMCIGLCFLTISAILSERISAMLK
jgi:hypothetical protein